MSNPEEKASKPFDPMQRLASFKPPRDYTLGGPKPNKKIFTPNLNVSRNKNKGLSTSKEQKKEDKSRKERKNDRNGNLWNKNIIKSTGVFSEGLGSGQRHSTRSHTRNAATESPVLQRPTIRVKDVIKIDRELEEQKIRAQVSHGILPDDDNGNFKVDFDKNAPIKLPMDAIGQKQAAKANKGVTVKSEPVEPTLQTGTKPMPSVKKEVYDDTNLVNLLNSTDPTLILVQLPDILPGQGTEAEESPRVRKPKDEQSSSSTTNLNEEPMLENPCNLKQLEEGKIGKLLVHRSGKVTLMLGKTTFELSLGTKPACYQEVVSVAADEQSCSACITSLGQLQHKLNVVPDWEAMFSEIS